MIRRYVVKGHSMEPALQEGDRLIVSSLFFNLKKGDVVVFSGNGMDLVKRITDVTSKDTYIASGDNAGHGKSYAIARSDVKGKLLMKSRF